MRRLLRAVRDRRPLFSGHFRDNGNIARISLNYRFYEECGPMRLVQSQATVVLARPGRPQKGCGIRKLAFALSLCCLFVPASARAQRAYITNIQDSTVSVIDTVTNTLVGSPIPVGLNPIGVAVTPDGSKVYVANLNLFGAFGTVSVIDTATNTVVGSPITVGSNLHPFGVAVTPDGSKVYVTNFGSADPATNAVSVIDTVTNTVVGSPIPVGKDPTGVAVTPDGSKVYVANHNGNTVSVIATATNTVVGSPIPVGTLPVGVAVTPDGSKVYVANPHGNTVSVIATATNTMVGSPIPVGGGPWGVAVTPDGSKVYVANESGTVSVIATATNTVVGSPITVGGHLQGVAVTPEGNKVYVANILSNTVSVIATATNTVVGSPITVGNGPTALGLFIQPVVAFSAFTAQLTVYPNEPGFSINSNFTLGASSSGINPRTEPVTLQIGSFKITIPPGSFVNPVPGYYSFTGVINGVNLTLLIQGVGGNQYIFGVIARNVSLTVSNPETITLTIGDDSGTTTVTPVIINTK
jgi:YVTN family beta-propeller protein